MSLSKLEKENECLKVANKHLDEENKCLLALLEIRKRRILQLCAEVDDVDDLNCVIDVLQEKINKAIEGIDEALNLDNAVEILRKLCEIKGILEG